MEVPVVPMVVLLAVAPVVQLVVLVLIPLKDKQLDRAVSPPIKQPVLVTQVVLPIVVTNFMKD